MCLKTDKRNGGFSFVELMAVLIVIAILALVSYPSYVEAVRKGKRTEGRAALVQLMQQQELFYSRHNTYIAFARDSADDEQKKFKWFSGATPKKSAYEISGKSCDNETIQNCVILTAKPGTENVDVNYTDPLCGILTLTSAGKKSAGDPDCWR